MADPMMAAEFMGPESMLFVFLSVGAIAVFSMISVASWSEARRKEREAYYRAEMMKKVAESPQPGAVAAVEYLREQQRIASERARQGLRIGGVITTATGIGVMIFLRELLGPNEGVFFCGLIPLFVGLALYGSSYMVTAGAD